ncbi:galactokinase-like [Corticium candelabrum]|uniref:galactokinase-like n=1 Tax=Corticium candelabrum TaxID=121492 RepID=UPI002E3052C0|nr:galactokinase-like [Corticium candelabrum]
MVELAVELFRKQFGCEPQIGGCSPGRVNLIGEHTDYNDGYVLPMALENVTVVIGRRVDGDVCTIVTGTEEVPEDQRILTFPTPGPSSLLQPIEPPKLWHNYVKGVLVAFDDNKGNIPAFQAVIVTTVPLGGGLSSSAALEVATYVFLEQLCPQLPKRSDKEKALACQWAEHRFPKMPCGIMDQYISVMGKKDYALLIDCRNLAESEHVPLNDPQVVVLITNSCVKHELGDSAYPLLRAQCESAAKKLNKPSLRDVTTEQVEAEKGKLTDDELKRCRHVVSEIQRTKAAADALKTNNYVQFGKLMNQSHNSLRDDYEVSCKELDRLVALAQEVPGVYGSRMTGAGFGGCTVTLVQRDALKAAKEHIQAGYKRATFIESSPADGARSVSL